VTSLPPARRPVALVALDVIASIVILFFGAVLALTVVGYATVFGAFTSTCGPGPYEGLVCNSTALAIASYGLITVTIVGYFLGFGMVIVSLIRRRYTFWWPLGAVLVIIAAFYLASWVAGMTVPA